MTARLYKSTDASAPSLAGTNGSLVALLDAVLVNGYGSQSAAGWTKPYNATNKGVYRNSTTTGTGFYLDVDDSGPGGGGAREARVKGYEAMTAVATGTNPFPTVAQMSTGMFVRKSASADSTARPWYILADETVFYLFVESGDYGGPTRVTAFCFGDFYSFKANDAYRCMIIARTGENTGSSNYENFPCISPCSGSFPQNYTLGGHYLARPFNGVGTSTAFGKHADTYASGTGGASGYTQLMGQTVSNVGAAGNWGLTYPNPADGGLYMAPVYLHHNMGLRGYLKGLWCPSHDNPLAHCDTFSGTGAMASKSFLVMQMLSNTDNNGAKACECFLETSNTWS